MKYSAVDRVEPIITENNYISSEIKKKKKLSFAFFKKTDIMDMAIIIVSLGVAVSLGFVVAGLVKILSGTTIANAISALM